MLDLLVFRKLFFYLRIKTSLHSFNVKRNKHTILKGNVYSIKVYNPVFFSPKQNNILLSRSKDESLRDGFDLDFEHNVKFITLRSTWPPSKKLFYMSRSLLVINYDKLYKDLVRSSRSITSMS